MPAESTGDGPGLGSLDYIYAPRTVDLPPGPATTFRAPGGLRLAIYEASRPFLVDSMSGQGDF